MIYFIQSNGDLNIKIGFTEDSVDSRQKAGETWNALGLTVLATMAGDRTTEAQLHRRFALARIDPKKEWFRPVPELLLFILKEVKCQATPASEQPFHPERYQFGAGVPITDFMHDEGERSDFSEDEQPGIWSQTCALTCPVCTHSMREVVGSEHPSFGCPGADRSASVLLQCKEGCLIRFNFAERDGYVYFWAAPLSEDDQTEVFIGDLADEAEREGNAHA